MFFCGFSASCLGQGAGTGGTAVVSHSPASSTSYNLGGSGNAMLMSQVIDTTNTFPVTGGAGIGTRTPATALEVVGGVDELFTGTEYSGRFSIGYADYTCCGQAAQYMLLAPESTMSSANPTAGLSGTLYCYRGSTLTFNIHQEYRINIQTAYSNTLADVLPLNANSNTLNLYAVTYQGAPYIAINVADISSYGYQITFKGFYWNNVNSVKPQLVLASACTNITTFQSAQSVWSHLIYATASGNIGIGTANPQSLLAVAGLVTAKGVSVTQNNWSDFVFDSTYQRMSLGKVAEYAQAYKHLPDIPSASDIEKDGLNLGDMQKLQMQKIEELTLDLIDSDKRASRQDSLIAQQQIMLFQFQGQLKAQQTEIDRLKDELKTLQKEIGNPKNI